MSIELFSAQLEVLCLWYQLHLLIVVTFLMTSLLPLLLDVVFTLFLSYYGFGSKNILMQNSQQVMLCIASKIKFVFGRPNTNKFT